MAFMGAGIDRAAALRGDEVAQAEMRTDPRARAVLFWRGRVFMRGAGLARVSLDHPVIAAEPLVFLGIGDAPVFAVSVTDWDGVSGVLEPGPGRAGSLSVPHPGLLGRGDGFVDLRSAMAQLGSEDAVLSAMGRSLLEWHRLHGFCAACGAESEIDQAGWRRRCGRCGRAHFPRTDPAVIMRVTHQDDVLIGRGQGWPVGFYSLLAGFVEPGETLEDAVIREVSEEAGIDCGHVRYLASQPWPFPGSLMIGCAARATSRAITLEEEELADAMWLSRADARPALAGENPDIRLAHPGTIARALLESWVAEERV